MNLLKRVHGLEARGGLLPRRVVHRVLQPLGVSEAEALDAYGRSQIRSDDLVIVRSIRVPKSAKPGANSDNTEE